MNELIQELADQCGFRSNPDIYDRNQSFDISKFAELIIRECVQTLIDNTPERYTNESAEEDWDKGYDRAMKDCVHHIQEHFGVK